MHGMQEVTGSIPVISTRKKSTAQECAVLFCCVCPAMQLLNSCWTFAESYGIILSAVAGIVHRLVYQPSKLRRWVRFPLPAPSKRDVNSSRIDVSFSVLVTLLGPVLIFRPSRQTAKQQAVPAKRSCLLLFFILSGPGLQTLLQGRPHTRWGRCGRTAASAAPSRCPCTH